MAKELSSNTNSGRERCFIDINIMIKSASFSRSWHQMNCRAAKVLGQQRGPTKSSMFTDSLRETIFFQQSRTIFYNTMNEKEPLRGGGHTIFLRRLHGIIYSLQVCKAVHGEEGTSQRQRLVVDEVEPAKKKEK